MLTKQGSPKDHLKAGGAPIHEHNRPLILDIRYGVIDVDGGDISSVEQTARHIFAMSGIAFHHLIGGFKTGIRQLSNG